MQNLTKSLFVICGLLAFSFSATGATPTGPDLSASSGDRWDRWTPPVFGPIETMPRVVWPISPIEDEMPRIIPPETRNGVCDGVDFTEEQAEQAAVAFHENNLAMVGLRGEVKIAKILYRRVLSETDSTIAQAEQAAANLAQNIANIITGRLNLRHKIIYNIATVEQRPTVMACFKAHDRAHHDKDHGSDHP